MSSNDILDTSALHRCADLSRTLLSASFKEQNGIKLQTLCSDGTYDDTLVFMYKCLGIYFSLGKKNNDDMLILAIAKKSDIFIMPVSSFSRQGQLADNSFRRGKGVSYWPVAKLAVEHQEILIEILELLLPVWSIAVASTNAEKKAKLDKETEAAMARLTKLMNDLKGKND